MNEPWTDPREDLAGRWRLLPDRCVFQITGPDRVRYLNGQVSNNVAGPLEREAIAACLCTIKGKVEALVWIHAEGEVLILDGELRQRDFLRARLERYLIADDCEIEDVSDRVCLYHHFLTDSPGVRSQRIGVPGVDLLVRPDLPTEFHGAREIDDSEWSLLETIAAIPRSGCEINGEEFPAELSLDAWAVDFRKGCYLGQEIVSRIRSVGRVKRELLRVKSGTPMPQGEVVRTTYEVSGLITRNSVCLDEKTHLTLALFYRERKETVDVENQRVVDVFETAPQH